MAEGYYLHLYESREVPGMAIALLSDIHGIMDLDIALNRTTFSLVGKKAFVDYMPAMQGKKVTSDLMRNEFPDSLESVIRGIEFETEPAIKRVLLNLETDQNYNPSRRILTITSEEMKRINSLELSLKSKNIDKEEKIKIEQELNEIRINKTKDKLENQDKEELKKIFKEYPVLIFPEIDRKENSETKNKINKVKIYEISEEILLNAYKNGVFEGNHVPNILLLKDKTLARLYGEFGTRVSNALKTSRLRNKTGGENIEELKQSLKELQEIGSLTGEAYNDLLIEKNNLIEKHNALIMDYNKLQKSTDNYKILVSNSTASEVRLMDKVTEIETKNKALDEKNKALEEKMKEQELVLKIAEEQKISSDDIEKRLLNIGKSGKRDSGLGFDIVSGEDLFNPATYNQYSDQNKEKDKDLEKDNKKN